MSRNQLIKLRPEIHTIDHALSSSPIEIFQNKTLRPVLKFQNDLLMAFFKSYLGSNKLQLSSLSDSEAKDAIKKAVQKDQSLKHQLTGIIVGLFSMDELSFYLEHEKELKKRILQMCIQRLQSQLGSL